jgi:hypothetical protein
VSAPPATGPGGGTAAYRRVDHVAWRRIGRETVVLDLKNKRVYAFNEAGGDVWHTLAPEGSAVAATGTETAAFLAELATHGVIEPATGGGTVVPVGAVPQVGEAPRVIAHDDVRSFGVSCLQTPIQGGCQARPTT